jgi:hypothetical protein
MIANICADSIRVVCPLFQEEGGGSIPTSALQLNFTKISTEKAVSLNCLWHSRVPYIGNPSMCFAYGAEFDGIYYAIAMWSSPIAREFNGRGYLELRRMAISSDSPKYTASRMLGWMARDIKKNHSEIWKLISYQDTEVHSGTIYRASGWKNAYYRDRGRELGWSNRGCITQTKTIGGRNSPKIRWELDIRPPKQHEKITDNNLSEQESLDL